MRLCTYPRNLASPSLFAHMKYGNRRRVRPNNQTSSPLNVRLMNEFTEDEKCHNLMSWLICKADVRNVALTSVIHEQTQ